MHPYSPACGLTGGYGWTCRLPAAPSRRRDKPDVWVASVSCQSPCLEHRDHRCPSQTTITAAYALLSGGGGWARVQNRLGSDLTPLILCAPCSRCERSFAAGGESSGESYHPLPTPRPLACVSGLAPRPRQIPLHGSTGTSSCLPTCPPARRQVNDLALTLMFLHLAARSGSPGDQTPLP